MFTLMTGVRKHRRYKKNSLDLNKLNYQYYIPSCIFNTKLSSTETIIRFLKDSYDLNFEQIAQLLNKKKQSVWRAYKNSIKKHKQTLQVTNLIYPISLKIFQKTKLSLLENLVFSLKNKYQLSFSEISSLLMRNPRTIWTVYNRARKKNVK